MSCAREPELIPVSFCIELAPMFDRVRMERDASLWMLPFSEDFLSMPFRSVSTLRGS